MSSLLLAATACFAAFLLCFLASIFPPDGGKAQFWLGTSFRVREEFLAVLSCVFFITAIVLAVVSGASDAHTEAKKNQEQFEQKIATQPASCTMKDSGLIIDSVVVDVPEPFIVTLDDAVRVTKHTIGQPLPAAPQPGNTYFTLDTSDPLRLGKLYLVEETCTWAEGRREASYTVNRVHQGG